MANRAYLRVWTRNFSEATLIEQFVRFLATAPLSSSTAEFTQLLVQSVDPAEPPVADWELRGRGMGAAEVVALAAQLLHADTAYFVAADWDLWEFDAERMKWEMNPTPLQLACYGPEFDGGVAAFSGNFEATFGLEHHFTGHAGLLTGSGDGAAAPDTGDAVEHRFARWMAAEANLREYHQKTRQNIQRLFDWMDAIQRALPVEREELWSEGEENFEARLDAIAAHS